MSPTVSVAIPTYNRHATLGRAVRSALGQTHADLEVVVSDDGSTDGTEELLRERLAAEDERLRVIRQPANLGMVANIEAAGRLARGDHVMLLADDDWLEPRWSRPRWRRCERSRPASPPSAASPTPMASGGSPAGWSR